MEVTVPDKLSAFKAVALVVAGEMFAVYGEGAASNTFSSPLLIFSIAASTAS